MKMRSTLQLESHSSIWAVGDILDFPEGKRAVKANGQFSVLIPNLLAFLRDRNATLTKTYTPSPENIVLTSGAVRMLYSGFCGTLIVDADDVLEPTGGWDWIPRPVVGSYYNLGLDHQALVGQTPDGRTLQEYDGFPLKKMVAPWKYLTYLYPRVSYYDSLHDSTILSNIGAHKNS